MARYKQIKHRKGGPHIYPEARQSTRGVDKYDIYEQWRTRLQQSGYTVSEKLSRAEFSKLYSAAKEDKAKNITRSIAYLDITIKPKGMKKIMTDLMTGRNMTLAEYYDSTTGQIDLQGKTRKELYDIFKQRAIEDHNWTRDPDNPEEWEKAFFRKGGLY